MEESPFSTHIIFLNFSPIENDMMATVTCSAQIPVTDEKQSSVKGLAQSAPTSIPSSYFTHHDTTGFEPEEDSIPVIDFSLLTSCDPDQRSKAIKDLGRACEDWGFFTLVNHGVPECLIKALLEGYQEFSDLPEEKKKEYMGIRDPWAPIRVSSGVDSKVHSNACWRDFLKTFTHPHFNFPTILPTFKEVAREYNKATREISKKLLNGISKYLGLEEDYIIKSMDFDLGFQVFGANYYPPCPKAEQAMGIPAHTDHGLITLLIQNCVGGLQIKHNGKWFNVDPLPNSFLVNTADQLQVLTNGKIKSVWHRAAVNSKTTRISVAAAHGPPLDKVVEAAPELLGGTSSQPLYKPMAYKEYMELQQYGRSLESIRTEAA